MSFLKEMDELKVSDDGGVIKYIPKTASEK